MTKARKSLLTKGEHLGTRVYLQVLTAFKHTDRNRTENVILRLKISLFLSRWKFQRNICMIKKRENTEYLFSFQIAWKDLDPFSALECTTLFFYPQPPPSRLSTPSRLYPFIHPSNGPRANTWARGGVTPGGRHRAFHFHRAERSPARRPASWQRWAGRSGRAATLIVITVLLLSEWVRQNSEEPETLL